MQRFADQPLGDRPALVVLGAAKLGNYVVLQPLLQGLRRKYPHADLTYVGSRRTIELERRNPWIDRSLPLAERGAAAAAVLARWRERRGPIDLVINADGHSPHTRVWVEALAPRYVVGEAPLPRGEHPLQRLALDPDWSAPDLERHYTGWIGASSITALFCRVAWLRCDGEPPRLPAAPPPAGLPPVLLAVDGERPAKLWPLEHWRALCARLAAELDLPPARLGLVGAPPVGPGGPGRRIEAGLLADGVRDLRGRLPLPQLVGAMAASRLVLAIDSGPMHLAAAAGCPTVAIFATDSAGVGASPARLWAPRSPRVLVTRTPVGCDGCHALSYANDACVVPGHPCMAALGVEQVWPLVLRAWREGGGALPCALSCA
ncbi:MAG: glycosyltransferase family 9 protein [Synechococcaceae cyanobacterium]|nr:glycosyltransferase family 9 protein [Synechococcaceae cyanobacterium]